MFSTFEFQLHSLLAIGFSIVDKTMASIRKSVGLAPKHDKDAILWENQGENLTGKVVIITGSNTGIGYQSAEKLASYGATVILACRDVKKGKEATERINQKIQGSAFDITRIGNTKFMQLDLGDLTSVISFSKSFKKQHNRLDILINNAGLSSAKYLKDLGLQEIFVVNYLGHYLLFRALQSHMQNNKSTERPPTEARVVNLSSVMHHCGQPLFEVSARSNYTPEMKKKFSYYRDSKLYMNYFTLEINRRFDPELSPPIAKTIQLTSSGMPQQDMKKRPIVAISVNPGGVRSDIWRNMPAFIRPVFDAFSNMFFLSTEQGSVTTTAASMIDIKDLRAYQAQLILNSKSNNDPSGRLIQRPDVPYIVPYKVFRNIVAFEQFGRLRGPYFGGSSFPDPVAFRKIPGFENVCTPATDAKNLWEFSQSLCREVLEKSGLDKSDYAFLR